jgi:hypothetical protein
MMVADAIRRTAQTNSDGVFTFDPLPLGTYRVMPTDFHRGGDRGEGWVRKEVPGVFVAKKLTISDGTNPVPLDVRAAPHVVIEGGWVDSSGKPKGGWSSSIFGQIDGGFWHAETHPDADGRFSVKVPHGLEKARMDISTNEHASIRHRMGKGAALEEGREVNLTTPEHDVLDHDVKGIEIVRYVAPIIVINATTKDGKQVTGFTASAQYTETGGTRRDGVHLSGGMKKGQAIQDEKNDGRYRTSQLLPDKEVNVTVTADGYGSASRKLTLPEGKTEEVTLVLEPK